MRTCLVVDDSSVIRKVARRILEGLDFQIIEAEDGEKALEVCKRGLPDAILLDWNMPVMDGYEFLGNLRRMPGGDQPKVVFCTTENDVAHIARALRAGANEYIMKPFDKDIVTAKFQEVGLPSHGAGVTRSSFVSRLYQIASGRVMSTEPAAGGKPRHGCIRRDGFPRRLMSRRSSACLALRIGIRVAAASGDVNLKSFQFASRGRP